MELALAQESAEQNTAQLQAPSQTTTPVNKLGGFPNPKASNGKKSFGTWTGNTCKKTVHSRKQNVTNARIKGTWLEYAAPRQNNAAPRQARAQNSTLHMEEI